MIDFLSDFAYTLFRYQIILLFNFELNIAIVTYVDLFNTNLILRIHKRSDFSKKAPNAARSVVLAPFIDASFPGIAKRRSNYDDISKFSLLDNMSYSQIVLFHSLYVYKLYLK